MILNAIIVWKNIILCFSLIIIVLFPKKNSKKIPYIFWLTMKRSPRTSVLQNMYRTSPVAYSIAFTTRPYECIIIYSWYVRNDNIIFIILYCYIRPSAWSDINEETKFEPQTVITHQWFIFNRLKFTIIIFPSDMTNDLGTRQSLHVHIIIIFFHCVSYRYVEF